MTRDFGDPDPVTIHQVRYHLLYLTPRPCKKTLRSIPSPLHRGCFVAGSQKSEKQKGFMTRSPCSQTSATSIFSLRFSFLPPLNSPPISSSSNANEQSLISPPPHCSSVLLFDFPTFLYSLTKSSFWSGSFVLAPNSMDKL